eukprot:jgi/Hompol1/1026/HPOL_004428-RA
MLDSFQTPITEDTSSTITDIVVTPAVSKYGAALSASLRFKIVQAFEELEQESVTVLKAILKDISSRAADL